MCSQKPETVQTPRSKVPLQYLWLSGSLKNHIKSVHEKTKYQCEKCDYQATAQRSLKKHKQSKHLGVKYPCSLCDYQATQWGHLFRNFKSVHEKIKLKCEYQATESWHRNHIKSFYDHDKYYLETGSHQAMQNINLKKSKIFTMNL